MPEEQHIPLTAPISSVFEYQDHLQLLIFFSYVLANIIVGTYHQNCTR